jgi:predicted nucleic acid-binding Zn ribbon protein
MSLSVSLASTELEKMASLLSHVVGLSKQLGTSSDGPNLRDQIQYDVKGLSTSSQNVKRSLTQLKDENESGVDPLLERFEALRTQMQQELPPIVDKLRNSRPGASIRTASVDTYTDPLLAQRELDGDTDVIDTLENQVHGILSSMRQVSQLFGQTLQEIKRQRRLLVAIEGETAHAVEDMSAGTEEVRIAHERQQRSTKCICWIILIVALVVVAVVLIIVWQVKWSNDPSPTPRHGQRAIAMKPE